MLDAHRRTLLNQFFPPSLVHAAYFSFPSSEVLHSSHFLVIYYLLDQTW